MLGDVIDLYDGFLCAATHMGESEVAERYRSCPRAFTCVLKDEDSGASVCGYFVLLPLNESGTRAVRGGSVTSGREIRHEYLAGAEAEAVTVYLSVVCGVHARARAAAINGVIGALRDYYQRGVRHMFVRAATTMGSRILQRLIAVPFGPDGLIHEVDLAAYTAITMATSRQ